MSDDYSIAIAGELIGAHPISLEIDEYRRIFQGCPTLPSDLKGQVFSLLLSDKQFVFLADWVYTDVSHELSQFREDAIAKKILLAIDFGLQGLIPKIM